MLSEAKVRVWFAIIVAVYLVLAVMFAIETPAWQAPDEPAHYNYIKFIATRGELPELVPGDYAADYLEEIKARRFPASMSVDTIRYESHQPPAYYVLAAPVYLLTQSSQLLSPLIALRLFSVALGAASLLAAYLVARAVFPGDPVLVLGTVAFAATLPMHVAITGAVNSDVLAELLLNLAIWRVVSMRRGWTLWRTACLSVLLGLAFLTKMQSYVAFGVAGATLAYDCRKEQPSGRRVIWLTKRGVILLGVPLLMALPWLTRNIRLYGWTDPLGLARHGQVVTGQLTTMQYVRNSGLLAFLSGLGQTTFRSFWGQFGWMGVPLDRRIYLVLGLLCGLAVLGAIIALARRSSKGPTLAKLTQRNGLILVLWGLFTVLGYLWWNTKYLQHQGRYLFPALVPWGLVFTIGLRSVFRDGVRASMILLGTWFAVALLYGVSIGDVDGFLLAVPVAAAICVMVGHALERWRAGVALAVAYVGFAVLTALSLHLYILPALAS